MGSQISTYLNGDDRDDDQGLRNEVDTFLHVHSEYHPSEQDIFETRYVLLRFIPLELVNLILDEARYWPRILAYSNEEQVVCSGGKLESLQYLLTPPILRHENHEDGEEKQIKVREVVFWIRSRDQGWCDPVDLPGIYDGSWTWFDACIYRTHPGNTPADSEQVTAGEPDRVGVWHLQRNVRALPTVKLHTVIWTIDGHISEGGASVSSSGYDRDKDTGAGSGEGFISSLRAGDRIAITGNAIYPQWTNYIHGVAVEIFYSIC